MTALAPDLAKRWARRDSTGYRDQLLVGFRLLLAVTIPAPTGLALLAQPIVTVALAHHHSALTATSAHTIAETLALMAIGLPAFSGWLWLTRAYQAMQDTRTLFLLYLVENGVNIVAALILYPLLGVRGLALALAIAYPAGTLAALAHLRQRLARIGGRGTLSAAGRVTLATTAMAIVVATLTGLAPTTSALRRSSCWRSRCPSVLAAIWPPPGSPAYASSRCSG